MSTQEILANADNISLEQAATQDHSRLCEIWPIAKEGLEILKNFIKNPIVKAVVESIIAAGDAIIGKICS
ncbi:hypothetical protein [Mucilaginibacter sp.]|uniref:hypothetical protein n=1 Tax=Mucilaginibacter sp. TaxID=1882438 RepID=UPI0025EBF150|nr:hypothetical protein [Mucilaginibacter sp.]